ncbi:MAG TPA: copper-containing nitrite reductase [Gammaproteobacteria bacterium]|nr:copper-containing nitrite reductase [Gammaproteobacteria bacterium]
MNDPEPRRVDLDRRRFMRAAGTGAVLLGVGGLMGNAHAQTADSGLVTASAGDIRGALRRADSVAADADRLPPPISRDHAIHHDIELVARQVVAKLDSGASFEFMTWDGQVPGPMIRVRQGDTVSLTVTNARGNTRPHNVDMHAVYGTGGGSAATMVGPGQSHTEKFKCLYPGAFIYHCAVGNMDEHISRGMFGMILVEPRDGLPPVDREFYIGQHELYTQQPFGSHGTLSFDYQAMAREDPGYVLFNGAVAGYTAGRFGPLQANVGETVRVLMVSGGPNLMSSFHAIGNVWTRCWPQGALANPPLRYVQTQPVPPGSCFVGDMELPVPETIKLVDHALSRVARKGLLAEIEVKGKPNPDVYRASA